MSTNFDFTPCPLFGHIDPSHKHGGKTNQGGDTRRTVEPSGKHISRFSAAIKGTPDNYSTSRTYPFGDFQCCSRSGKLPLQAGGHEAAQPIRVQHARQPEVDGTLIKGASFIEMHLTEQDARLEWRISNDCGR